MLFHVTIFQIYNELLCLKLGEIVFFRSLFVFLRTNKMDAVWRAGKLLCFFVKNDFCIIAMDSPSWNLRDFWHFESYLISREQKSPPKSLNSPKKTFVLRDFVFLKIQKSVLKNLFLANSVRVQIHWNCAEHLLKNKKPLNQR